MYQCIPCDDLQFSHENAIAILIYCQSHADDGSDRMKCSPSINTKIFKIIQI
jgi:hypothetical protein